MKSTNQSTEEPKCEIKSCSHSHTGEKISEFTSLVEICSEEEKDKIYKHFDIPIDAKECCVGCQRRLELYIKSIRNTFDESSVVFNVKIRDVMHKTVENDLLEQQYLEEQRKIQEEKPITYAQPTCQNNIGMPIYSDQGYNPLLMQCYQNFVMNPRFVNQMLFFQQPFFLTNESYSDYLNRIAQLSGYLNTFNVMNQNYFNENGNQFLNLNHHAVNNGINGLNFIHPQSTDPPPSDTEKLLKKDAEEVISTDSQNVRDVPDVCPTLNDTLISVIKRVGDMQVKSEDNLDSLCNLKDKADNSDDDVKVQKRKSSTMNDVGNDRGKKISETNFH